MSKTSKDRRSLKRIKLQEELKTEQMKAKEYLNQLKYLQADFENYKKRVEREFIDVSQRGNERLVANLLSVMDDLEKAIEIGRATDNLKAFSEGVEMVYKNFKTILEREGLVSIDAVGKPFDPSLHEVISEVPTNDYEEGIIVEEARKGFMFRGKVIRPSVVKLACKVEEGVKDE